MYLIPNTKDPNNIVRDVAIGLFHQAVIHCNA